MAHECTDDCVIDNDGECCGEVVYSTWDEDCAAHGVDHRGRPRGGDSRRYADPHCGKDHA